MTTWGPAPASTSGPAPDATSAQDSESTRKEELDQNNIQLQVTAIAVGYCCLLLLLLFLMVFVMVPGEDVSTVATTGNTASGTRTRATTKGSSRGETRPGSTASTSAAVPTTKKTKTMAPRSSGSSRGGTRPESTASTSAAVPTTKKTKTMAPMTSGSSRGRTRPGSTASTSAAVPTTKETKTTAPRTSGSSRGSTSPGSTASTSAVVPTTNKTKSTAPMTSGSGRPGSAATGNTPSTLTSTTITTATTTLTTTTTTPTPDPVIFCFAELYSKSAEGFPPDGLCTHVVLAASYKSTKRTINILGGVRRTLVDLLMKDYKNTEGAASIRFSAISRANTTLDGATLREFYEQKITHFGVHDYKGSLPDVDLFPGIMPTLRAIQKFQATVAPERVGMKSRKPLYTFFGAHFSPYDPSKRTELAEGARRLEHYLGFSLLFVVYTHVRSNPAESPCVNAGAPLRSPPACKRISLVDYADILQQLNFQHSSRTIASVDLAVTAYQGLKIPDGTEEISLVRESWTSTLDLCFGQLGNDTNTRNFIDEELQIAVRKGHNHTYLLEEPSTLKKKLEDANHGQAPDLGIAVFSPGCDSSYDGGKFARLRAIREALN